MLYYIIILLLFNIHSILLFNYLIFTNMYFESSFGGCCCNCLMRLQVQKEDETKTQAGETF